MLNNKKASLFLNKIKKRVSKVLAIKIPGEKNSFKTKQINEICDIHSIKCEQINDINEALKYFRVFLTFPNKKTVSFKEYNLIKFCSLAFSGPSPNMNNLNLKFSGIMLIASISRSKPFHSAKVPAAINFVSLVFVKFLSVNGSSIRSEDKFGSIIL